MPAETSGLSEGVPVAAMKPLQPAQLWVLRIRAGLLLGIVLALIALLDDAASHEVGPLRWTELPFGVMTGAVALLGLAAWVILPTRRFRGWAYREGQDELHLRQGRLIRTRTVVPFVRVQHIDIAQGPVERLFGLVRLVLHTAGTRSAAITLPGLAHDEAEAIRDRIRDQMRQDLR